MGTDIHAVFQARKDGKWVEIPTNYQENRHYTLFGWLAGVRNGFGFAGIYMHEPLEPISGPRGLPRDFEVDADGDHPVTLEFLKSTWRGKYPVDDYLSDPKIWMGDHSFSFLGREEILSAAEGLPTIRFEGVLSMNEYMAWDGISKPISYCADVSGPNVNIYETPWTGKYAVPDGYSHVRVSWMRSVAEMFRPFLDIVESLPDGSRMVFGFDS